MQIASASIQQWNTHSVQCDRRASFVGVTLELEWGERCIKQKEEGCVSTLKECVEEICCKTHCSDEHTKKALEKVEACAIEKAYITNKTTTTKLHIIEAYGDIETCTAKLDVISWSRIFNSEVAIITILALEVIGILCIWWRRRQKERERRRERKREIERRRQREQERRKQEEERHRAFEPVHRERLHRLRMRHLLLDDDKFGLAIITSLPLNLWPYFLSKLLLCRYSRRRIGRGFFFIRALNGTLIRPDETLPMPLLLHGVDYCDDLLIRDLPTNLWPRVLSLLLQKEGLRDRGFRVVREWNWNVNRHPKDDHNDNLRLNGSLIHQQQNDINTVQMTHFKCPREDEKEDSAEHDDDDLSFIV